MENTGYILVFCSFRVNKEPGMYPVFSYIIK